MKIAKILKVYLLNKLTLNFQCNPQDMDGGKLSESINIIKWKYLNYEMETIGGGTCKPRLPAS